MLGQLLGGGRSQGQARPTRGEGSKALGVRNRKGPRGLGLLRRGLGVLWLAVLLQLEPW